MKHVFTLMIISLCLVTLSFGQDNQADSDSIYIFYHTDVPALFPGCEDLKGTEQRICSNETLDAYIDNIKEYPKNALKKGTRGKCVIEYTVLSDGTMKDIELTRDIGDGCGAEALRVFKHMQEEGVEWTPAQKDGQSVHVRMKTVVGFFPGHKGIFTPVNNQEKQQAKAFGNIQRDR